MTKKEYNENLVSIKETFGAKCRPETIKPLYFKMRKRTSGYVALVKFGLFGRWRVLNWQFYSEKAGKGYTKMRACSKSTKNGYPVERLRFTALRLIWDFRRFRGAGITIW